jgi:CheY-like chemotaxis protein
MRSPAPPTVAWLDMIRGGVRPSLILLDLMMPGMNGWDFRNAQRDRARRSPW